MKLNDNSPSISSQKAIFKVDTPNLDPAIVLALVKNGLVLLDESVRRQYISSVYISTCHKSKTGAHAMLPELIRRSDGQTSYSGCHE